MDLKSKKWVTVFLADYETFKKVCKLIIELLGYHLVFLNHNKE